MRYCRDLEDKIAQKLKGEYVLRVIFEDNQFITVVTVYPAKRERYARGVSKSRV